MHILLFPSFCSLFFLLPKLNGQNRFLVSKPESKETALETCQLGLTSLWHYPSTWQLWFSVCNQLFSDLCKKICFSLSKCSPLSLLYFKILVVISSDSLFQWVGNTRQMKKSYFRGSLYSCVQYFLYYPQTAYEDNTTAFITGRVCKLYFQVDTASFCDKRLL